MPSPKSAAAKPRSAKGAAKPAAAGGAPMAGTADAAPDAPLGACAAADGLGVTFRVWAPHAQAVSVVGGFNGFEPEACPMLPADDGTWSALVPAAKVGDEYRFALTAADGSTFTKIDPRAREVTNSVGNAIVHDPSYDWGDGNAHAMPAWNKAVIYELHIGTFNDPGHGGGDGDGTFKSAEAGLRHLARMGVNVVQIMPAQEFAGNRSWGYNPAHIFAVENTYGGPKGFKDFVKLAHSLDIAVVLDVVYNHFGPSDLDLWQFDGWSEDNGGGIYFYNDWRRNTPWGDTRPDYGREEVRRFIRDNAVMWLDEYRVDGLRWDATVYVRTVRGPSEDPGELPDGWSLMQWVNDQVSEAYPNALVIAEDLQNNAWKTKSTEEGGAAFGSQWDAGFVHPIRAALVESEDNNRSMAAVAGALSLRYNDDAFGRVIYTESHDEVANGRSRIVSEVDVNDHQNWFAKKRSTLGNALTLTAPGIPMIFQGAEFLEGEWFRDTVPLDWDQAAEFQGIIRLYRDLIHLRTDRHGFTKGLTGQGMNAYHVDETAKVVAFHRFHEGGPGDDVIVIANFRDAARHDYVIGMPRTGAWKVRFSSDWKGYAEDFGNFPSADLNATQGEYEGMPANAKFGIAPYSVLIVSQDPPSPSPEPAAAKAAPRKGKRA